MMSFPLCPMLATVLEVRPPASSLPPLPPTPTNLFPMSVINPLTIPDNFSVRWYQNHAHTCIMYTFYLLVDYLACSVICVCEMVRLL